MLERLRSWLAFRRVRNAKTDAVRWLKNAKRVAAALEQKRGELKTLRRLFNDTYDEALELVEQSKAMIDKYEPTMEALRSKCEVLEDTLVPELVAAHRLALERIDADISLQIRRRVGHEVNERE